MPSVSLLSRVGEKTILATKSGVDAPANRTTAPLSAPPSGDNTSPGCGCEPVFQIQRCEEVHVLEPAVSMVWPRRSVKLDR
jgi:hypothetical protein